ncbi:5-carboxymethyl-2-hydroxymuconate Delta-isomerase [Endozoicomonas sp. G2_1]|uniref:5-carboxymethyl-2-hydroxymuconate Delta-isomerase n=1 Tax=Endozoicomonas sp. G2_1 TaxID=2821091 RepID=UPI001ADBF33D|nr:5-carboxymethyl-2-hydroxymuconate Delta-isomerase [Endozoicomonas sp. G2_1]MBO9491980.1 5-carboxymethyl-2-hydroxymuconate Delta-isomerase [Endozoicomonas sp. G2_1]
MPHCIIEYSSRLNGELLVNLVHQGALASDLFQSEGSDIKVRAMPYQSFKTGSVNLDFIHVTMRILPGRSAEQKSMLTGLVLQQLQTMALEGCSISVEVADIDKASYAKVIV